jgi:hypothetical protein
MTPSAAALGEGPKPPMSFVEVEVAKRRLSSDAKPAPRTVGTARAVLWAGQRWHFDVDSPALRARAQLYYADDAPPAGKVSSIS